LADIGAARLARKTDGWRGRDQMRVESPWWTDFTGKAAFISFLVAVG